eukprot:755315-Hanusia_phi.AAC.4
MGAEESRTCWSGACAEEVSKEQGGMMKGRGEKRVGGERGEESGERRYRGERIEYGGGIGRSGWELGVRGEVRRVIERR